MDPTRTMDELEQRLFDLELELLLQAIHQRYHFDFRQYSRASVRRRLLQAMTPMGVESLSQLQHRILREPDAFATLLGYLTVQVSELFRDPPFFLAMRQKVVPLLRTYPSLKMWIAGCSNGEEVYSYAILLEEEGLLDRTMIYATDIHLEALRAAERGVYDASRVADFSRSYQAAGGKRSLSDYYTAGYGNVVFDRRLRNRVAFSDHSLATDEVFAEVHLVSCRNVLIYFDKALQDRAFGLFRDALVRKGFLGLGAKETLRFSSHADEFTELDAANRIYQRRG